MPSEFVHNNLTPVQNGYFSDSFLKPTMTEIRVPAYFHQQLERNCSDKRLLELTKVLP